jgi:hypothetical protein
MRVFAVNSGSVILSILPQKYKGRRLKDDARPAIRDTAPMVPVATVMVSDRLTISLLSPALAVR